MARHMNKMMSMTALLFAIPLSSNAATPVQCDETARTINQQNTFIVTGTAYHGPVKSISTTSYRSMGLILWVKEKIQFDSCAALTQYDYEYREMAMEEGQVPITQSTHVAPGFPDQVMLTINSSTPEDTQLNTLIRQDYGRDADQRITRLTESYEIKPEGDTWQTETRYRYHENRLASEKETEGDETRITIYRYNDDGLLTEKDQPNVMTQEYAYNDQKQVINITQKLPTFWGKSAYSYTCFKWDQYGNCELQTMIKAIQLQDSAAIQSSGITLESRYEYY